MKRPKGVKYKPMRMRRLKVRDGTFPPADKTGPCNVLAQGGPNSGTGPDIRKFHHYKRILLRDFKDGLDNQDKMNDVFDDGDTAGE